MVAQARLVSREREVEEPTAVPPVVAEVRCALAAQRRSVARHIHRCRNSRRTRCVRHSRCEYRRSSIYLTHLPTLGGQLRRELRNQLLGPFEIGRARVKLVVGQGSEFDHFVGQVGHHGRL